MGALNSSDTSQEFPDVQRDSDRPGSEDLCDLANLDYNLTTPNQPSQIAVDDHHLSETVVKGDVFSGHVNDFRYESERCETTALNDDAKVNESCLSKFMSSEVQPCGLPFDRGRYKTISEPISERSHCGISPSGPDFPFGSGLPQLTRCGSRTCDDFLSVNDPTHMSEARTQSVGALNSDVSECRTQSVGALNFDEMTFSHSRTGGTPNSRADAPSLKHRSPPGQARTAVMVSSKPGSDESDFSSLSDHNLLTFGGCTEG